MHARLWRWRVPIGVATAAVAGGCVTRMLLTPKPEPNRSDEASRARLAVSRQAPKVVRVAYRDAEGLAHMARIDERRLHLETQRQLAALEASRPELHAEARAAANAQLDEVFARLQGDERVSLLADWYYAYTTAYELLGVGLTAGAMAKARGGSASDSAASAVADAVLDKYTALVLRPAVVEPAVRRGLECAAAEAHRAFVTCVSQLHAQARRNPDTLTLTLTLTLTHTIHLHEVIVRRKAAIGAEENGV